MMASETTPPPVDAILANLNELHERLEQAVIELEKKVHGEERK